MTTFLEKISPEWSLRIGIGAMYLYSGFDLFFHPKAWSWALPYWLREFINSIIPLDTYLKTQGIGEIIMAIILLSWFLKPQIVKWFALLSALEMFGILALGFLPFNIENFSTTFRDIGLLGGSLALFLLLLQKEKSSI